MVVATERASPSATPQQRRIFISYKRDTQPDGSLASFLHDSLGNQGHNVFIDVEIPPGSDWSEQLSTEIRSAEFFIVLLSETSAAPQGFVGAETIMAKDSQAITGHPKILPVRVAYTKNLPLRLSAAIGHLQHFEWRDAADNDVLLMTLLQAIGKSERSDAEPTSLLLRGDHFIVTKSMWHSTGARESLAGTTIVPVTGGQETNLAVTRTKGPGFFGVKVLDGGSLEVAIWKGADYRRVESEPGQFITMLEGDSHGWCFARHTPDEAIVVKRLDGRKDPIVVTFDQEIVRAVWLVTHQRGTDRESFLIVMKDSSAN